MNQILELREKRAKAWEATKAFLDSHRNDKGMLSAEDDATLFLYEIKDDGTLAEVAGAEYDDSDEGFYFRTRTLGSYVVSDMELDLGASDNTNEDVVVTPVEPTNPSTGAIA